MSMLRVYQSMEDFRQESSLRTWAFKVAVNTWTNALRDAGTQKRSGDEVSINAQNTTGHYQRPVDVADSKSNPEEELLDDERSRALWEAISHFPTKMGRCLLLSLRDGLSNQEIATVLRIKRTTVKSHLQTGRRRLKRLLRERFGITELRGTPP